MISFCVATVPSRTSLLSRCLASITRQAGEYEVLVYSGEEGLADKLNFLYQQAQGSHVVAVDDDDYVDSAFMFLATAAMAQGAVDFYGYRVLWLENGTYAGSVAHRGDGSTTWRSVDGLILDRGVSPKCLTSIELARSVPWVPEEQGADRRWAARVQELVESHTFIDWEMYVYDHWGRHMIGSHPNDGLLDRDQRYVGIWPYSKERIRWV